MPVKAPNTLAPPQPADARNGAKREFQVSRVQPAVVMPLDADEEEVTFSTAADTAPPQPYLQYDPDDAGGGGDRAGGGGMGDANGGGNFFCLQIFNVI